MKKIIVLFTILFVACHAFAQEKISGYVEDSLTHNRLANVSVTLLRNGKPLKFTRSKEDGTFLIPIAQKQASDMLQATYMGYKKQKTAVSSGKETIISMASTAFVLKEVQVKGSRITGRDTISFDLTRFANERDNSLKDVLKKLPGVDIEKNISPDEKMIEMIYTRLDAVKEVVFRNGTLRANFFRDIWRVEKVRKRFDAKEILLFKDVLREGVEKGVFRIDDIYMTDELVHYCVKGIEVPYIRGHIGAKLDDETRDKYVVNLVFGALHRT